MTTPPPHILKLVQDFLTAAGEHASSVLVLLDVPCECCHGTNVLIEGCGSRMSHLGMAHEFLDQHSARINAEEFARAESEMYGEEEE